MMTACVLAEKRENEEKNRGVREGGGLKKECGIELRMQVCKENRYQPPIPRSIKKIHTKSTNKKIKQSNENTRLYVKKLHL